MQADFVLDYNSIPLNQAQTLYLMARFVSGPAPQDQTRRSLNLSLVIDRSGSMAGAKLDFTRQAAQFLVQNLSAKDTLSIVLYNEHVETLLPPEKVRRKDIINQRIESVKAKGTTNLSSGWLEGCKRVQEHMDPHALNRVILMSDGLANRGITTTERLRDMARQKLDQHISTTTMGMGKDFNEDLLMEMAHAGGGAYYYIESPEVAPLIFKEELSDLLKVLGQNLLVTIEPTRHVTAVRQMNAYPMHAGGGSMSFRLGDIFGDEVKALLLELTLPPFTSAGQVQLALLRFEYDELGADQVQQHAIELPIMVTVYDPAHAKEIVVINPEVSQSVLLLKAAQARKDAVQAADSGDYRSAAHALRQAADAIQAAEIADGYYQEKLNEEQSALYEQAAEIEKGEANYDKGNRKSMSTQAIYTMTNRHDHTVQLRDREKKRQTLDTPTNRNQSAEVEIKIEHREGIPPTHATWNQQTFTLNGDLIRIGRSKHNEIVILAQGVSRFHCQIKREGDKLYLEDTGSTNGTMIAGELIKAPHLLSVGDVAYICDEKLIFHEGDFANG